ncbi:MAG: hypothetical protein GXX85_06470 [Ignavibacteria bacterium]|nr:hypothetical protein [Ignavibacteria bacterium]
MKNILLLFFIFNLLFADDGYRLWLKYDKIKDARLIEYCEKNIKGIYIERDAGILKTAACELEQGLEGLLGKKIKRVNEIKEDGIIVASKYSDSKILSQLDICGKMENLGNEGYLIVSGMINGKKVIYIIANEDAGVLYGVFHFLRLLQTNQPVENLNISEMPKISHRILNH